jgi:hypothetical protein
MLVKHNHNCLLCNQSKTCFVFSEFSMLFSVCRDCYDELMAAIDHFEVQDDVCSFCDQGREVKKISGFDDALFFSDMFICSRCLDKMKQLVDLSTSD